MRMVALATLPVTLALGSPAAAQSSVDGPPAGWREAMDKSLDLTLAKKYDELIALWEKWVAAHPKHADGHGMLGGAHESLARELMVSGRPKDRERATAEFTIALTHLRRALDLGPSREIAIRSIADIYGPIGLNKPAEREAFAREVTTRFPAEPRGHVEVIGMLAYNGRAQDIPVALATARRAIPDDAPSRVALAEGLWSIAYDFSAVSAMLEKESLALLDEALKKEPTSIDALRSKARLLRDLAKRTTDPARAKNLTAEADRLEQRIQELRNRR